MPVKSTFVGQLKMLLLLNKNLFIYEQFTDSLYWTETPDERFRFVPDYVSVCAFIPEFVPAS
jgi:hypothetical protein